MTNEQLDKMIHLMISNDNEWYACMLKDGTITLKHKVIISIVLAGVLPPTHFNIKRIEQCGYSSIEDAREKLLEENA